MENRKRTQNQTLLTLILFLTDHYTLSYKLVCFIAVASVIYSQRDLFKYFEVSEEKWKGKNEKLNFFEHSFIKNL